MASTITIDKSIVRAGETALVTFTFYNKEFMSVIRGQIHNVTVTGGTMNAGSLSGMTQTATTRVFTPQFIPTPPLPTSNRKIPTPGLEKSDCKIRYDGTGDIPDGEVTFAVDTLRPTVASASIAKSDLRLGEKTTITITFSELVTRSSFTLEDLQIDAGKGTL